jgi:hypothetical protein
MTEAQRKPVRRAARGSTIVVTNFVKVVGLFFAVRELLRPDRDEAVLAFCAFMMSGAQLSEAFIWMVIGRRLLFDVPMMFVFAAALFFHTREEIRKHHEH